MDKKILFHDQQGIALLEFCFVLPFFLLLMLTSTEAARFLIIQYRVEKAAYTLADIVSQYLPATSGHVAGDGQIDETALETTLGKLPLMMDAYSDINDLAVIITSVTRDDRAATPWTRFEINWQYSNASGGTLNNATTRSVVNDIEPTAISAAVKGTKTYFDNDPDVRWALGGAPRYENLIVVEVFYEYRPMLSSATFAQKTLIGRKYLRPRNGNLDTLPPTFLVPFVP